MGPAGVVFALVNPLWRQPFRGVCALPIPPRYPPCTTDFSRVRQRKGLNKDTCPSTLLLLRVIGDGESGECCWWCWRRGRRPQSMALALFTGPVREPKVNKRHCLPLPPSLTIPYGLTFSDARRLPLHPLDIAALLYPSDIAAPLYPRTLLPFSLFLTSTASLEPTSTTFHFPHSPPLPPKHCLLYRTLYSLSFPLVPHPSCPTSHTHSLPSSGHCLTLSYNQLRASPTQTVRTALRAN